MRGSKHYYIEGKNSNRQHIATGRDIFIIQIHNLDDINALYEHFEQTPRAALE
jgi:hypothetical protein